jgi:hypothetical protein
MGYPMEHSLGTFLQKAEGQHPQGYTKLTSLRIAHWMTE